jgi:hypothetical protein
MPVTVLLSASGMPPMMGVAASRSLAPSLALLVAGVALALAIVAYRRAGQALVAARRAAREQLVFALREAARKDQKERRDEPVEDREVEEE